MFFYELKYYGFKRVKGSSHMEFGNANFVRGKPELLLKMQRNAYEKNFRKFQETLRAEEAAAHLQHLRI